MPRILLSVLVLLLAGCSAAPTKVTFDALPDRSLDFVTNALAKDKYPSRPIAEGNIYSCRYGIRLVPSSAFVPAKPEIFARLLAEQLPAISARSVVLERFDVFYNWRLRLLGTVSTMGTMGAVVQGMAGSAAAQNKNVVTDGNFSIDLDPLSPRAAGNQVGCDDVHEGEYYASEVTGGNDVLVTWLAFSVDAKRYLFRTFYQFKPESPAKIEPGTREAVRLSIAAAARQIEM